MAQDGPETGRHAPRDAGWAANGGVAPGPFAAPVSRARAAATTGVGAVLASDLDQVIADVVEQFGWERSGPDSGDIRLGDADDPFDVARTEPGTKAAAAGACAFVLGLIKFTEFLQPFTLHLDTITF